MTGNQHNLSATPSGYVGYEDRPVEQVSHDDIQVFFARLNEQQAPWLSVLSSTIDQEILDPTILESEIVVVHSDSELLESSLVDVLLV